MHVINETLLKIALTGTYVDSSNTNDIEVLQYDIKDGSKAGNNYCAEVTKVTVKYKMNQKVYEKKFYIKIPSNSRTYSIMQPLGLYENETSMYRIVLPEVNLLLEKSPIAPGSYFSRGNENLILDDLTDCGYQVMDRRAQLDYEHCCAALKGLAKFHAATHVLHLTEPQKVEFLKEGKFFASQAMLPYFNTAFDSVLAALEKTGKATALVPKVRTLKDKIINMATELTTERPGGFNVINHGDFWTCNVMFKHDKVGKVIDVMFIDFQMSRWCSPVIDILYFLATSVRFEMFCQKKQELYHTYLNHLNDTLSKLGCSRQYSMEQFLEDMEASKYFLVLCICCFLNVILSDPTREIKIEKVEDLNVETHPLKNTYEDPLYQNVAIKWLNFLDEQNSFI